MTDNLTAIKKAASIDIVATSDGDCPAGYFVATTKVLGILTSYLLEGTKDDDEAPIVGRVEANEYFGGINAYRGDRIKGGELFSATSYDEAWAKML